MGLEGVEKYVVTPEIQSESLIGTDPLPPGQVWGISPGKMDEYAGLYRVDVNVGPGSGVKILNVRPPGPFRESIKYAEQNLYARAKELVGNDRDPRQREFAVQLRAFDAATSGAALGIPALLAFCSALLEKSLKGGLAAVGGLNLAGGLDPVYSAVDIAELAVEKGATTLLIPISARRQLYDLSDEMAMKLTIIYYGDAREALIKALAE
jgi:ATP-dependent Lon protease